MVSPKQCAACHEKEVAQHQPSHHAKGGQILASLDNIMGEVIGGPAAVNAGCLQCHGGTVKVDELTISGVENNTMVCGEPVSVQLRMHLGEMKPQEILVQLVIGQALINGSFRDKPEILRLEPRSGENGQDGMRYTASYIPSFSGHYRYGVRIMPVHPAQASPLETDNILWA